MGTKIHSWTQRFWSRLEPNNYYLCVTTELYLHHKDKDRNKFIFDELIKDRHRIEKQFGESIDWARLDDRDASRIKRRTMENVDWRNKEDWNRMIDFMVYGVIRMEKTFREPLARVKLIL